MLSLIHIFSDSVGTGTVTKGSGWYFFKNCGKLKITGGIFNKPNYDLVYIDDNAVTEISGGTFMLDNILARQSSNAISTISGGSFTVDTIDTGFWGEGTTVTGGTFKVGDYPDTATYLYGYYVKMCIRDRKKMACFIVPAAEAVVTAIAAKAIRKKENTNVSAETEINEESGKIQKIKFSRDVYKRQTLLSLKLQVIYTKFFTAFRPKCNFTTPR